MDEVITWLLGNIDEVLKWFFGGCFIAIFLIILYSWLADW